LSVSPLITQGFGEDTGVMLITQGYGPLEIIIVPPELPIPVEVITKFTPVKEWEYEYVWRHIPFEKVRALVKRFNFAEMKIVKAKLAFPFIETKRIKSKVSEAFFETISKISSPIFILFGETKGITADVEKKFEETQRILGIVYSQQFVQRTKILMKTISVERDILDEYERQKKLGWI